MRGLSFQVEPDAENRDCRRPRGEGFNIPNLAIWKRQDAPF
jgi:hypothetical protein